MFYGPSRSASQEKAVVAAPTTATPPSDKRTVRKRPTLTAVEKMEVERQRVAISRAVSRKMRIPTARMSSGDFHATVTVDNVTEQSARCALLASMAQ